jgi:hypothetical protein
MQSSSSIRLITCLSSDTSFNTLIKNYQTLNTIKDLLPASVVTAQTAKARFPNAAAEGVVET